MRGLAGGKDNFAADRAVGERVAAAYPDVLVAVRAQRAFLARAVHFLVAPDVWDFPGGHAEPGENP